MKNIISFPENRMKKVRKSDRIGARQAVLSLSVVSILMGALLINDSIGRSSRPIYIISDNIQSPDQIEKLNRAIASAQPMNPFRDLSWERNLAKRLGQEAELTERAPASVSRKISSIDQLRFGALAGKYHVVNQPASGVSSKIQEIEYIDSNEVTDRPVYLNPDQFLKEYGSLLAIDFLLFDRANNPAQTQVREYRLLNGEKRVVGTAAFTMDDEGRFLALKVRSAAL
jgi:hypothetical protein